MGGLAGRSQLERPPVPGRQGKPSPLGPLRPAGCDADREPVWHGGWAPAEFVRKA